MQPKGAVAGPGLPQEPSQLKHFKPSAVSGTGEREICAAARSVPPRSLDDLNSGDVDIVAAAKIERHRRRALQVRHYVANIVSARSYG